MADGKTRVLEFRSRELSLHHLFLAADDLGLLDVGEEVEVLLCAPGERFRRSRARVVGSERAFGHGHGHGPRGRELALTASGYRLAFVAPGARFRTVVEQLA